MCVGVVTCFQTTRGHYINFITKLNKGSELRHGLKENDVDIHVFPSLQYTML